MNFDDTMIQMVWEKGQIIYGWDERFWRKDYYGWWMHRFDYGDRNSELGWEIDHIVPVSEGGTDSIFNLRPLYWRNNISRAA